MGSFKHSETSIRYWRRKGKSLTPLAEKLQSVKWGEYRLGDLFDIYHGKRLTRDARIAGNIPLLTAGEQNQGVAEFIGNDWERYNDPITIDMFGNCFFHKGIFSGDDNIYFFVNDSYSYLAKIFIVNCIWQQTKGKYSYAKQFRQPNADKLTVFLPIKSHADSELLRNSCKEEERVSVGNSNPCGNINEIDFDFMENFIRELEEERIRELQSYLAVTHLSDYTLTDEEKAALKAFDTLNWQEFRIGDLFKKLNLKFKKAKFEKDVDVSKIRTVEFSLPLVNAKDGDNGIMYYGNEKDFEYAEMTIDIVNDGAVSTGNVYPQPQKTGVLYNAYLIKPNFEATRENLFFFSSAIYKSIKTKFGYEYKASWERVKEEFIMLPVKNGTPDYAAMETFIDTVQKLVIKDVVEYTNKKIIMTRNLVNKKK